MAESIPRREFMQRAAAMIPLMHFGGWCQGVLADEPQAAATQPISEQTDRGRFSKLRLKTAKIEPMLEFYRKTLGLPCEEKSKSEFVVKTGHTNIEFASVEDGDQSSPFYHFAFNIPHNKLDAAVEWMKDRCPLVKRRGTDEVVFNFSNWDAHAIYFTDPSGNIVEFIARHTLKNDRPGAFSVDDILHASEIGVVTNNVLTAAESLRAGLHLENYRGGSAGFTAVGDEHGLFIIVPAGRIWLASDLAAKVFSTEIQMRTKDAMNGLELVDSELRVKMTKNEWGRH